MYLYEEMFLLALNDQKGQISNSVNTQLHYGLSGAILSDLVLLERINLDDDKHFIILSLNPINDSLLDDALVTISNSAKAHKAGFWVKHMADNLKKLSRRVGDKLVDNNVLTRENKRYFWVMPSVEYPNSEATAKYWVKQWLREAVLIDNPQNKNPHALALLGLVRACDMLEFVFTRDELKTANRQIDQLVMQDEIGKSVQEALDAIEAAAIKAINAED